VTIPKRFDGKLVEIFGNRAKDIDFTFTEGSEKSISEEIERKP